MALAPVMSLVPFKTAAQLEDEARAASDKSQAKPIIQSLAAHVRERWEEAKDAKRDVEERMVDNLTRRRGQYDSQKLAQIRSFGGSEIFMGITSVKCRAACAWLRDTLMGTGLDRPWQLEHTPEPELPPDVVRGMEHSFKQQARQQTSMTGVLPDPEQLRQTAQQMKEQAIKRMREEAKRRVERMELKIEDQLIEGGWLGAFSQFLDDLVTFPTAVIKGPVARNRKQLKWSGQDLQPIETVGLEWERVDPFMLYPAPWASSVHEGYLIERHRLTREALQAMIGVDGYDEAAIKTVLTDFESGGLNEWLWIDSERAEAEGKESDAHDTDDLIDALQLWDSVQGKLLIEWGIPEAEVADPFMSYPCEVWLVGGTVIRAVLNYDPLGRKPYYATSYEKVPGSFWGNSVVDLVRDPQDMVNASARALANNMGVASGPQVEINTSRLPPGEDITQMYPWKIWQSEYHDFQDSSPAVRFFQPSSNAQELLTVLEKFATLADEYSGIPRYMTGEHVAGAGRTSSGLSMLINNAAKSLKHVVANIDADVITPMLERLYQHNLRYNADPDMLGDVRVVAKGAMSLVSREAAAVRRNEFMQLVLGSPAAQEIVGPLGTAELLRENAKLLDVNPDRLVPTREELQQREAQQMQEQQAQTQAQQAQMQAQMQAQQDAERADLQAKQLATLDSAMATASTVASDPTMLALAGQAVQGAMALSKLTSTAPVPGPQGPQQEPPQGLRPAPASAPLLPDGSRQGGRDSNNVSPRPNMR
jgi:hypothetical protein